MFGRAIYQPPLLALSVLTFLKFEEPARAFLKSRGGAKRGPGT